MSNEPADPQGRLSGKDEQTELPVGEWNWDAGTNDDGTGNGSVFVEPRPGQARCIAKQPRYMSDADWRKVAPLLAAAPELLAALKIFRSRLDCRMGDTDPADAGDPDLLAMQAASAAIAKAEGTLP